MKNLSVFTINYRKTAREAFKNPSMTKNKFVIVVEDNDKVIGIVTDGDFRRAVWNSVSLEAPVETITNKKYIFFSEKCGIKKIKKAFLTTNVAQIPILRNGKLVDVVFKSRFDEKELKLSKKKLNIPVVIMAGGLGVRLDPFTRILPKPLIPIGGKPVIEIIMNKFAEYGADRFYITVNNKSKMIKAFFEDFDKGYNISYIDEEKPLGTAGALKLLEKKVKTPFIVSNCDIIIDADYSKILEFHRKGKYIFTLVGSMLHHIIPYGVCKIKNRGELADLKEKPEYDFLVNTGMYIVNPDVLKLIPHGEKCDITEIIHKLQRNGKRVGVYPISEKSWVDIGQWEEYKKVIDKIQPLG